MAFNYRSLYDMKRDVILTCDQKPTRVRLIYSTEQQLTGENRKTRVNTDILRSIGKQSRRRKVRLWWERFAKKESFKFGVKE